MYMAQVALYRRNFIRAWRKHRGLTLEQLAERVTTFGVETTHASLSRIERSLQPYNQPLLEAIADALRTDAASLLMRNPLDPDAIWTIWDQAKPAERDLIRDMATTILKRRAG